MPVNPKREPILFAAGDTLTFERSLPDFLPSAGWSLEYQIRGGPVGSPIIEFTSTPDSTNTIHELSVDAGTTSAWLPLDYILVGYATNGTERHQIYYAQLTVTADLGTDYNNTVVTTHAQRMIRLLENQLEELAAHPLEETNIQQTMLRRVKRDELEKQLALNKEIRAAEVAAENVRMGRQSGRKIVPAFNVTANGPLLGMQFPR